MYKTSTTNIHTVCANSFMDFIGSSFFHTPQRPRGAQRCQATIANPAAPHILAHLDQRPPADPAAI